MPSVAIRDFQFTYIYMLDRWPHIFDFDLARFYVYIIIKTGVIMKLELFRIKCASVYFE